MPDSRRGLCLTHIFGTKFLLIANFFRKRFTLKIFVLLISQVRGGGAIIAPLGGVSFSLERRQCEKCPSWGVIIPLVEV